MNRRQLLKGINYIVTTVLFIALIFTLFLVISSKTKGEDMNLFGYQIKSVLSGSMEPAIETGSVIFVKIGGDMTRFKKYDVINYINDDQIPVTHRVIQVDSDGLKYVTKGDANDGADLTPIPAENIIGVYTGFTIPYVGYILSFATSKQGMALLLFVPGLLLIIRSIIITYQVVHYVGYTRRSES